MKRILAFLQFNVLFFIVTIIYFSFFTISVYSSGEFVLDQVTIDSENNLDIKLTYLLDQNYISNFKIGVSCDNSDFRLGNILNVETSKYINYATGSWVDTPQFSLTKNQQIQLKGKVFDSTKCLKAYLRVRSKTPDASKFIDINYSEQISITEHLPTPTPTITSSPTILPVPSISITPTIETSPTPFIQPTIKKEESSSDEELLEVNSLSPAEKDNVFISEFYPNPLKDEDEWVEIYNKNDHPIELKDWFLDDLVGKGGTPFIFTIKVGSDDFGVIKITKSLLNNTEDTVNLLDENKDIIHSISYKKTIQGESIQKNVFDEKWYITASNTKGLKNINIEVKKDKPHAKNDNLPTNIISPTIESKTQASLITDKNPPGLVLGSSTYTPSENTTQTPVFNPIDKFTLDEPKKGYYILKEKDIPNTLEVLFEFFNRVFW